MESLFSRPRSLDVVSKAFNLFQAKAGDLKTSKINALKTLTHKLTNSKDPINQAWRKEWLKLYASLCRYNDLKSTSFPTINDLSYQEWKRMRMFEPVHILLFLMN